MVTSGSLGCWAQCSLASNWVASSIGHGGGFCLHCWGRFSCYYRSIGEIHERQNRRTSVHDWLVGVRHTVFLRLHLGGDGMTNEEAAREAYEAWAAEQEEAKQETMEMMNGVQTGVDFPATMTRKTR